MTLKIQREVLLKSLSIVSKAVSSRAVIPILENILFVSDEDELTLVATNLQMTVIHKVAVEESTEFQTTVPAKLLKELIAIMSDEIVLMDFDTDTQILKVSGKQSKTNVKCITNEEFPPLPEIPETILEIPSTSFSELINLAIFATSTEESRPVLNSVYFKCIDENLTIQSADGFQATTNSLHVKCKDFEAIVPASPLNNILGFFSENVKIALDDKNIFFSDNQTQVAVLTDTGQFPNINQIVEQTKEHKLTGTFLAENMIQGCKHAMLFVRDHSYHPVSMSFKNGICEMSAVADQTGDGLIQVPGKLEDETEAEINLDAQKLFDFLSVISGKPFEIYLKNAVSPIVCKVPSFENYVWIVMPIHV